MRLLLSTAVLAAGCASVSPMPPEQLTLLSDSVLCERQREFSDLLRTPPRYRRAYSTAALEQGLRDGGAEIASRRLDCTPFDVADAGKAEQLPVKCKSRTDAFGTTRTDCQ